MKKRMISMLLTASLVLGISGTVFAGSTPETLAQQTVDKSTQPRILITTDLEVDDQNGLLLSLMFATDYDLAGIVWTAGQYHFSGDGQGTTYQQAIDEYYVYDGSEEDYQPGFEANYETGLAVYDYDSGVIDTEADRIAPMNATAFRPIDSDLLSHFCNLYAADYTKLSANNPNYPTADYIRSIAKVGNVEFEGDYREDTEGSDLIKECMLDDDMRTLYIQHWGGSNTTIRALYSIYEDYHNADGTAKEGWDAVLAKVTNKVRFSSKGEDNCWSYSKIDEMFPGLQTGSYSGFGSFGNYWKAVPYGLLEISIPGLPFKIKEGTNATLNPYYQGEYLTEAFKLNHGELLGEFHLMNDGQTIYGEPSFYQYGLTKVMDWREAANWGYAAGAYDENGVVYTFDDYDWMCSQFGCNSYVDLGLRQGIKNSDNRYVVALFDELAARADWAIEDPANCNHAPVVTVDQLDIEGVVGETISLTGNVSDPDGDTLAIAWSVPTQACTYKAGSATADELAALTVADTNAASSTFVIPADAQVGDKFVVNMEVKDDASRSMTRYAQYVVTVKEGTLPGTGDDTTTGDGTTTGDSTTTTTPDTTTNTTTTNTTTTNTTTTNTTTMAPVTVTPAEVKATVSAMVETKTPEEYAAAIAGTAAIYNGAAVDAPAIAPVSSEMVEVAKAQLTEKLKDAPALFAAIGTSAFADAMKDATKVIVPEIKTIVDVTAPAGVVVSEQTPITLTFAVEGINEYSSVFFLHDNTTTGAWEIIKGSCGNGFVTGTFTSLSPIAIVQMSVDTKTVDASQVTSPKTGSELPIFPVIAVVCAAGIAFCAKKVKFN